MFPAIPAMAEDLERYPYTLFAASSAEGAISTTSSNFSVNGNIATNGTISAAGSINVNGTKTENAGLDMIYIFDKIDSKYFSDKNIEEHAEDYVLDELNININEPTEVFGEAELTGNININTALKAFKDVTLNGEVKNANDSVIYSKYGDIIIDSTNVNLNGLVYAPFGSVEIKAMNLNLNNVVIIANSIKFDCPNVNANYSTSVADFVGTISESLSIPKDEWQYMKDENKNGFPDFFEDFENWSKLADSDGDGLPDIIEEYPGSDPNNIDTDSDGLNDYYEVFGTFTDPTKADTDENGINDGDEDFDEDGLTNLEEFENKTNPYINDTDGDGLSDGDEVKTHGTNPLVADTDGDGLDDSDEIVLGTNPLVQDTDGDGTIDSKEKFRQTFTHKVKNEDCAVTEVVVDMECTGNINKTTTVESIMNVDILCTDVVGLVGEPFEIETDSEFDKATLTFKVDKNKLGDVEFENLLFLWYNEEDNEFIELETTLDEANGTASIVTTHFSRYMVVDKKAWFDAWAREFNYNPGSDPWSHGAPTIKYNTVIAIDCSGSMSWNDPDTQRADAAEKFIEYMHPDDKTAIVFFTSSAQLVASMSNNVAVLKNTLNRIYSSGGTNFGTALNKALSAFDAKDINASYVNNRIILLSDGADGGSSYALNNALESCLDKKIKVYTVGFGSASDSLMQRIADKTKGEYFKAFSADDLVDIFAEIGYSSDFDMTDTDFDGLPDAVESAGIRLQNGKVIYLDPTDDDCDDDGLLDGEEIDPNPQRHLIPTFIFDPSFVGPPAPKYAYFFKMYSNPTEDNSDSDYDGIEDSIEEVDDRLNNRFTVTWNPNTDKNDSLYKNISYTMDYSQFFKDNTIYNSKISTISSLMAALVYNGQSLVDFPDETEENSYVDQLLRKHGMKEVRTFELADMYNDQHITDVVFGHHRIKYNGKIKEIIAVVIRGTNSTTEEWSSNFDIGCDDIFYNNNPIPKNEDWVNIENHMGFDIAATRVIKLLNTYLSEVKDLDSSAIKTLWITGHSRGAGIANIVGAELDNKYETFVYTFASPMTTTVSEDEARSHNTIFNIINKDDIITFMPLGKTEDSDNLGWGFLRFGNDKPVSVNETCKIQWKCIVGSEYKSNVADMNGLLKEFFELSSSRNGCYKFTCICHGDGSDQSITYKNVDGTNAVVYGDKYQITDLVSGVEYYRHCESTAFFMQYLARLAASSSEGINVVATAFTNLAPKYNRTRFDFVVYSVFNITNPHMPISYYLLSNQ